jgi:hypothetical protein
VEEKFVIEVQEQFLAQAQGMHQQTGLSGAHPILLRNSRILVSLSFLGSVVALGVALCMVLVALSSIFPLSAMDLDRAAVGALCVLGAWLMAMAQVYLWRQGKLMGHCSVLLDDYGAHFKLGNTENAKEAFMPWNGIEAVHYKRIPNAHKFTILGADSSTVTFTSYSFFRPKKVARLIAERAGLPLVRG